MADNQRFTPATVADPNRFQVFETDPVTGEVKELWRVRAADGTVSYEDALTGAVYVPTGTVDRTPQRVQLGDENVTADDITAVTLTVPANARRAEIHVWNNAAVYTTNGTVPDATTFTGRRINDGGYFELEGDELATAQFVALDASANTNPWVEYFNNEVAPFE